MAFSLRCRRLVGRYMFSAERNAGKLAGINSKPVVINSVGIIGAGLMGADRYMTVARLLHGHDCYMAAAWS